MDPEQEHNRAPILNERIEGTTSHSSVQKHDREVGSRQAREVLEEIQEVIDVTNTIDHEDHPVARSNSSLFRRELHEECSLPDDECSNEIEQGGRFSKAPEISCVICLEGVNLERGLLLCGHWFCFLCIYDWARACLEKRKPPRCPLCKASFESIRKYTHTSDNPDQKAYTQTSVPAHLGIDVWVSVDNEAPMFSANLYPDDRVTFLTNPLAGSVCCRCLQNEFEDLLERCNVCQRLCVHRFCLDPPLFPWTCDGCKDLQTLHRRRLIS
ncbi:hypothetical protein Leryth_013628 [Lithospermum erythrorhizon]|nr:hypothetical protein Leryth_013628 [Lithospermum erythrorhizon]